MGNSIILTHSGTVILALAAAFLVIISWVVKNKNIANVLSCVSLLCTLACVIYALLLGATLTETLILILIFVLLGSFSFLSDGKNIHGNEDKSPKNNGKTTQSMQDIQPAISADESEKTNQSETQGGKGE
jgi:hypothetical protein